MKTEKISSITSKTDNYRIIEKNDNYGLNDMLTHDENMPMIEFNSGDFFISRYYLDTFMNVRTGLCLDGGARDYDLNNKDVEEIQKKVMKSLK